MRSGRCELCGRDQIELTRHHLVPRTEHGKLRVRKSFEGINLHTYLAMLCRPCHTFLHVSLTEQQLADGFSTVERLLEHPDVRRFVDWLRTKPAGLRVRIKKPKLL